MHSFAVYYIESNLVCVIVFGILLLHNYFNIDRQEKQIKFDHALIAFMLYFLTDCFWAAIVAEIIPKTRFNIVVNVFLIYLFMAAIIYFWLEFVMAYEQIPGRNQPKTRILMVLPFLLSTAALILNYIIAPQTLINDDMDTLPLYSVYLVAVPYIYMGAILFYTIRKARAEKNYPEKRKHLFVGFFPLISIAGGLVQMIFFPYIPIFCFVCMILMLVFYIQSLEQQISLDPLTNLNNRGQLRRYISQSSNLRTEGRLTAVIMMDIDDFKGINDTYGHAEGDKALVVVSHSLKKAVSGRNMPCFLARYGGDEFIMIVYPVTTEEIDRLIAGIRENIDRAVIDMPYPLKVSFGYDLLKDGEDTIRNCILRADKALYEEKENRKRLHKEF